MPTSLWAIALVIVATVFGSFASLFLKLGSKTFSFNLIKLLKNYKLIIGVFLYGVAYILFIIALKGGDLSVLYPFAALGYIWISLISVKFLKEKMNSWKWSGIAMIILGVSLIGIG